MSYRQFNLVNCQYGAPMGRCTYGNPEVIEGKVHVFKVRFVDGDYDDGGAYWGAGMPLYCARDDGHHYRDFIRAYSRKEAMQKLGLIKEK